MAARRPQGAACGVRHVAEQRDFVPAPVSVLAGPVLPSGRDNGRSLDADRRSSVGAVHVPALSGETCLCFGLEAQRRKANPAPRHCLAPVTPTVSGGVVASLRVRRSAARLPSALLRGAIRKPRRPDVPLKAPVAGKRQVSPTMGAPARLKTEEVEQRASFFLSLGIQESSGPSPSSSASCGCLMTSRATGQDQRRSC